MTRQQRWIDSTFIGNCPLLTALFTIQLCFKSDGHSPFLPFDLSGHTRTMGVSDLDEDEDHNLNKEDF